MKISELTFQDLERILETRRDFTMLRNTSRVNSAPVHRKDGRRVVFMLSDDYDLFNLDQEVIYDSAVEGVLGRVSSIRDEIQRFTGDRFLRNCFKD